MNDNQIDYYMGTATFSINLEANSSKTTYKGLFKVKCVLSPLEYIQSDAMFRELLGKSSPELASEYVSQLCYSLSQLKYRVMDCPPWFKNNETGIPGSHLDDNIIMYILDKAIECEEQYRKGIIEKYEQARGAARKRIDEEIQEKEEKQKEEEKEASNETEN